MTERYEEYHFYKDLGICVRCHKNPAEPHKAMCMECAFAESERVKRKRAENPENKRKQDLDKYYELKRKGICTYCRKEKSVAGKTKCERCLAKIRNKRNARKKNISRSERISYGLCYICGDKVIEGKGVCQNCYETRLDSIKKIMYMPANDCWKEQNRIVFKNNMKAGEMNESKRSAN